MTQQQIENIIKFKACLVAREGKESIYVLDREQIEEIARVIGELSDTKTK